MFVIDNKNYELQMFNYLTRNLALSLGFTLLLTWIFICSWFHHNFRTSINFGGDVEPDYSDRIVVGVLSARENFEQRQAIRDTWWPLHASSNASNIRARFFVGREPCAIHPLDRLDEHDCSQWNVDLNDVERGRLHAGVRLLVGNGDRRATPSKMKLYSTLQFRLMHAVVISKLGVIKLGNNSNKKWMVTVFDAAMQTIVTKAIISSDGFAEGTEFGGYLYRSIEPVLLPQGFVGNVVVDAQNRGYDDDDDSRDLHFQYDLAGGLIIISHVTDDNDGRLDSFDESATIVAASFGYVIHDLPGLRSHVAGRGQRLLEWKSKIVAEAEMLEAEMLAHEDVVLLDVLDVYRNLPTKLLAFYTTVDDSKVSCAVKTDDDTLLNLEQLTTSLADLRQTSPNRPWWWGRFRHNWAVERHGKWRETTYQSLTYPPFACGSAYVISADLVRWLSANRPVLHPFQGEDVSMGIWLAPLNPRLYDDERWSCGDDGDECPFKNAAMPILSRGQLEPAQMRGSWTSLVKCGNFCGCS